MADNVDAGKTFKGMPNGDIPGLIGKFRDKKKAKREEAEKKASRQTGAARQQGNLSADQEAINGANPVALKEIVNQWGKEQEHTRSEKAAGAALGRTKADREHFATTFGNLKGEGQAVTSVKHGDTAMTFSSPAKKAAAAKEKAAPKDKPAPKEKSAPKAPASPYASKDDTASVVQNAAAPVAGPVSKPTPTGNTMGQSAQFGEITGTAF